MGEGGGHLIVWICAVGSCTGTPVAYWDEEKREVSGEILDAVFLRE